MLEETFGVFPTSTPRGLHVETTWKRSFPRRFNVESTWCVCRVIIGSTKTDMLYVVYMSFNPQSQNVLYLLLFIAKF